MTIASDAIRKAGPFVGDGIVTVFPFTYKIFSALDLSVTLLVTATGVQTLLVLNTDYTAQMNANQDTNPGGTITTIGAISPIPNTKTITISGNVMADTQGTDLITPGPWAPNDVENMVDRAMIAVQQLRDRAIKFPVIDSVAPIDLPPAEVRKNTTFIFDGNGQVTVGAVTTVTIPTTAGAIPFGTGAGIAIDATKLFWDNANKRLGVGNAAPTQALEVTGTGKFSTSVVTPIIDSVAGSLVLKGAGSTAITITGLNTVGSGTGSFLGFTTTLDNQNLNIKAVSVNAAVYGAWVNSAGVRRGYFGYPTGSSSVLQIANEEAASIDLIAPTIRFPNIGTTANAANATLNAVGSNDILRSTSSVRYKNVLRDFEIGAARALIAKARPVVFESKSVFDYAGEEHVGFLAEDIAKIDPRFATYDVQGRPDWVQYPTFVVPLTLMAADHERRLAALEARTH